MKEINYENVINYSSQKFVMNIIPALISTNNYNETCKSIINKKLNNNNKYIKLCETLSGFLKYYSTNSNTGLCNNKVCCEYLNYWLNSQGREVNIPNYNTLVFYNIIKEEFQDKTLWEYCNFKIHHIEDFEFKKLDTLYKIHDEFNEFKLKKAKPQTRNDSCENAQKCVDLYNSIISLCHLNNDTSLCKALSELKIKIEKEGWLNSSDRMCSSVKELLSSENAFNNGIGIYHEYIGIGSDQSIYKTLMITTCIIIFGIFFILLILYKFTPFGSCFHNNTLRKRRNTEKVYKSSVHKLLGDENIDMKNIPYKMAYHSA
ncbi:hypothetical protein PVPAM_100007900 [Plasmodium vivax]|nr:hypothetical protein PVPAM_100007900 [Plasmodium vivax]